MHDLGLTPETIITAITDAKHPRYLRNDLSELIVFFMMHNEEEPLESKQAIYHSFYLINQALTEIEEMNERRAS